MHTRQNDGVSRWKQILSRLHAWKREVNKRQQALWIIDANFSGSYRIKTKEPLDMAFNIVTAVQLCQTHKPTVKIVKCV